MVDSRAVARGISLPACLADRKSHPSSHEILTLAIGLLSSPYESFLTFGSKLFGLLLYRNNEPVPDSI